MRRDPLATESRRHALLSATLSHPIRAASPPRLTKSGVVHLGESIQIQPSTAGSPRRDWTYGAKGRLVEPTPRRHGHPPQAPPVAAVPPALFSWAEQTCHAPAAIHTSGHRRS